MNRVRIRSQLCGIAALLTSGRTALQAIGQHHIGTNAQPIDALGVEELNSTTLSNLVGALNNIYGASSYALDPTADPTQPEICRKSLEGHSNASCQKAP